MGTPTMWSTALQEQLAPGRCKPGLLSPEVGSFSEPSFERLVTPLEDRHKIGSWQAGLVLFKAIVGPGILFLPAGVKNAGLVSAVIVSAAVGAVTTWCMVLLLDVAKVLRRQGKVVTGFADLGEAAYGQLGRFAVDSAIVTSQLGICTAYCVFVAENVQSVVFETYGGLPASQGAGEPCGLPGIFGDKLLVYYIILALIPLLIPSTWVRQIRYFACTNFIASSLVLLSLLFMLVTFAERLLHRGERAEGTLRLFEPSGTLVYFGTAVYAFEGIGVLLPTERCMANPSQCRTVVCCTMAFACSLQVTFASIAYWLFGEDTKSIITISLSQGSMLGGMTAVELVQLAWVVEVFLTFPLQIFPVALLLEPACFGRGMYRRRHSGRKWKKNAIRTGLLLLCMLVAVGGYSSVDNLVSLVGALGCVPLAIVYPAFFHWKVVFAARANGEQPLLSPLPSGYKGEPNGSGEEAIENRLPDADEAAEAPLGSPGSDLLIGAVGAAGVLLTTVIAIRSWATSSFEFQACVLRP